jgi:hypothetical protein
MYSYVEPRPCIQPIRLSPAASLFHSLFHSLSHSLFKLHSANNASTVQNSVIHARMHGVAGVGLRGATVCIPMEPSSFDMVSEGFRCPNPSRWPSPHLFPVTADHGHMSADAPPRCGLPPSSFSRSATAGPTTVGLGWLLRPSFFLMAAWLTLDRVRWPLGRVSLPPPPPSLVSSTLTFCFLSPPPLGWLPSVLPHRSL